MVWHSPFEFVVYGFTGGFVTGGAIYFMTFYTGAFWRSFVR